MVRAYAHGTACPACLKEFHTRERLVCHLKVAGRCWEAVTVLVPPLAPEEVVRLDVESAQVQRANRRAGMHDRKAHLPAYRIPGPLPEMPFQELCLLCRHRALALWSLSGQPVFDPAPSPASASGMGGLRLVCCCECYV